MYLVVNPSHQITTLRGVLLLNASHVLIHLFKYTSSPPRLLMRSRGTHIRSLLLFWQPLIP